MTNWGIPTPADGSADQVIQVDSNGDYVLGSKSPSGTTPIYQVLGDDSDIVWIGDGNSGTIDPDGATTTPVQDAIDALDAVAGGGGLILLPAGEVVDEGPLTDLSHKSLIGMGTGRGPYDTPEQHNSTITIDGGGDGIQVGSGGSGGFSDGNWCFLHNFTLNAHDQSNGRSAIRFNGSQSVEDFNMGWVQFTEWTNTNEGILSFENNQPFRSSWWKLTAEATSGPMFHSNSNGKPYNIAVGLVQSAPRDNSAVFDISTGVHMTFNTVMTGRSGRRIGDVHLNDEHEMSIRKLLCEPSADMSSETDVISLSGPGTFHCSTATIHNTGGYDQIFTLGSNNGQNRLPKPRLRSTTSVSNSLVRVTSDSSEPSYFFGKSTDVTEGVAGSLSEPIVCLGDLTTFTGS